MSQDNFTPLPDVSEPVPITSIESDYNEFWDQWKTGYLEPESEYGTPRYIDYCNIRPEERIIEIGCGSGVSPRLIGSRAKLAVFCDMHEPALVSQLAQGAHNCVLADGRFLPFSDATFDKVLIRATIHNLPSDPDREAMLQEAARVLVPGGRLVLAKVPHLLGGYLHLGHYRTLTGWRNWILRIDKFFHPQSVRWLKRTGGRCGLSLIHMRRTPLRSFDPQLASSLRMRLWQYYTYLFLPLFTKSPLIYDYLDLQFEKIVSD